MNKASSNFEIHVDKITKSEWDNILINFDDANIYQSWSYGAIRWREKNLSHIIIKENSEIVSAAQLRIIKIPFIRAGIAYLPWGPMWRRRGSKDNIDRFKKIIGAIKHEYAIKRNLLLRISPNVTEENSEEIISILNSSGFHKNVDIKPYRTLRKNLMPSLGEIRKSLDQKWRNQLNRAEKNDLKIMESSNISLFNNFIDLQKQMCERKKFVPVISYEEFRRIQIDLPELLKMRIFICEYNGKPCAATIGSIIGDTGIYLLGATGNDGMRIKGAYLLQWHLLQKIKEYGCKYYDLGGIDPDGNPGVYHFKSGISNREFSHIGMFEISRYKFNTLIVKSIDKINKKKSILSKIDLVQVLTNRHSKRLP
jgi:lipid II:glycine glycyltransferase (peptidoglycan interpeptide bridge formation enzyme)